MQSHEQQTDWQAASGGSRLCRPANPFVMGRDRSRREVIANYREWLVRQPALMAGLHDCAARTSSVGVYASGEEVIEVGPIGRECPSSSHH